MYKKKKRTENSLRYDVRQTQNTYADVAPLTEIIFIYFSCLIHTVLGGAGRRLFDFRNHFLYNDRENEIITYLPRHGSEGAKSLL